MIHSHGAISSCLPSGVLEVLMSNETNSTQKVQSTKNCDNQPLCNEDWDGAYTSKVLWPFDLLIIKDIQSHSTNIHLPPISVQNCAQNLVESQEDKIYCSFETSQSYENNIHNLGYRLFSVPYCADVFTRVVMQAPAYIFISLFIL